MEETVGDAAHGFIMMHMQVVVLGLFGEPRLRLHRYACNIHAQHTRARQARVLRVRVAIAKYSHLSSIWAGKGKVRVRIIQPKADNGLAVPKYEAHQQFRTSGYGRRLFGT